MIESIPLVLTGIGIIVSILYYTSVLRNANKTRELQLYMQLFQKDTSTEFQKIVFNLSKLDTTNPEKLDEKFSTDQQLVSDIRAFMFHLDGIGNMIKNGLIDQDYASQIGARVGPIMFWVHF